MSQVDQFESVFRSAIKDVYQIQAIHLHKRLLVTDLVGADAQAYLQRIKSFTSVLNHQQQRWELLTGRDFRSTGDLLQRVAKIHPDVIFTYRNLHSQAWQYPHSLGEQLDVLLQKTTTPVVVLPHPNAGYAFDHALQTTHKVMAVTNHLANDNKLVNYAHHFTQKAGELYLAHIEDDRSFQRIVAAIAKIPTIDTEQAAKKIGEQLLKAPHDYIESCKKVLYEAGDSVKIQGIISFGHNLKDYKKYIEQMHIDLLAMNTKDEDQLAMHGIAYPLAVELRQIPLLML